MEATAAQRMTALHVFATAALLMGAIIQGCRSLEEIAGRPLRPEARLEGARLVGISPAGAQLVFDVDVSNPYGVGLPVAEIGYAVASRGETFLTGRLADAAVIPPRGRATLPVPATVSFAEALRTLSDVRPGAVVPYTAQIDLGVDAPAVGRIDIPLRTEGELPVPAVPEVELASVRLGSLSMTEASAVLDLRVRNTNQFPVDLSSLTYALSLGGARVASASADQGASFPAGQSGTLRIPVSLSFRELGAAAASLVRGETASYQFEGQMAVGTPYGPMSLPFQRQGRTSLLRE